MGSHIISRRVGAVASAAAVGSLVLALAQAAACAPASEATAQDAQATRGANAPDERSRPRSAARTDELLRSTARSLANNGMVAYQAGDFRTAEENLSRAFASYPAPTLALWSARALEKLGKLVEAEERYRAAERASVNTGDAEVQRKAKADARREHAELLQHIPTLQISVKGAPLAAVIVRVDGVAVVTERLSRPVLVNPGEHVVSAEQGSRFEQARISLTRGERQSVVLDFGAGEHSGPLAGAASGPEDASPPDSGWRTVGWVGVGVGGAALATSAALGLIANQKRNDFEDACPRDVCPVGVDPAVRRDVETYNDLRRLSTFGWISGGVLMAGGLVILLTSTSGDSSVEVGLAPGALRLRGSF